MAMAHYSHKERGQSGNISSTVCLFFQENLNRVLGNLSELLIKNRTARSIHAQKRALCPDLDQQDFNLPNTLLKELLYKMNTLSREMAEIFSFGTEVSHIVETVMVNRARNLVLSALITSKMM